MPNVSRRQRVRDVGAGLLFLSSAALLAATALAGDAVDAPLAALLVVLYALFSRIEFPVGPSRVSPSYVVLVPMLLLLPPGLVPALAALGLALGRPRRILSSVPGAWKTVGPAAVLVAAGPGPGAYVAAFAAGCLLDLASAGLRAAPTRVLPRMWLFDACLAPIGLLAAQASENAPARLLLLLPLGGLLLLLARDRGARIEQAERRLERAFTDPLTGLGNRRLLAEDLRERFDTLSDEDPAALVLFDLNGLRGYNDTFGHVAGDALLARLAAKLEEVVRTGGRAYRLGGDEFCVLLSAAGDLDDRLVAAADALTEAGGEFTVTASHGVALVPTEADTPDHALQLAHERLHDAKQGRAAAARDQARDVLMRSLSYRQPSLYDQSSQVAHLSRRIARKLGMDAEEIDVVTRAAELHDLGKLGIPDVILEKSSILDESESEFIRQHTILGERILNAAPALRPVARIVRSTHERWDGQGYPDGLAGEEIPMSARIIAVCEAYEAMIDDRPYRPAIGHGAACRELRREAGRQFDPVVVETFLGEVWEGLPEPAPREENPMAGDLDEVTAHLRELLQLRREGFRSNE